MTIKERLGKELSGRLKGLVQAELEDMLQYKFISTKGVFLAEEAFFKANPWPNNWILASFILFVWTILV